MIYASSSSGRLELALTREQIDSIPRQGAADDAIAALLQEPSIAAQTAQWGAQTLSAELKEYGAWDDTERADHDANIERMVWLLVGSAQDEDLQDETQE